jgi:hypothetical protein
MININSTINHGNVYHDTAINNRSNNQPDKSTDLTINPTDVKHAPKYGDIDLHGIFPQVSNTNDKSHDSIELSAGIEGRLSKTS